MHAREDPVAAGAQGAARFFAGYGRFLAGLLIGAWSPPLRRSISVELPGPYAPSGWRVLGQLAGSSPSP
jgi:hypothetical protein